MNQTDNYVKNLNKALMNKALAYLSNFSSTENKLKKVLLTFSEKNFKEYEIIQVQNEIISIINNDFSSKICSRDKIAVWFTFFSEVKFKPAYHQICKERDLYYQTVTQDILRQLIKNEKSKVLEKNISQGFQALVMGLWLDQLVDPETFSKKQAKQICFDYLKKNFPKQFKNG